MRIITYPSLSHPDVAAYWSSYFKTTSVSTDYQLACHIENSLFNYGVDHVEVLCFIDQDQICGIMPICYESVKDLWSYWPSYMFIATPVTIDTDCWVYLPTVLPRPFRIHESSFRTTPQVSHIPWISLNPANVINLTPYASTPDPHNSFEAYLADLDKKTRSKLRNCLNRNLDVEIIVTDSYDVEGGVDLRQHYEKYCFDRFVDAPDFSYFQNQLSIFPELFDTAARLGQLITLQMRLDGQLVGLNYSILSDNCLYDYICYRETACDLEKKALGILAILKNIQWVLQHHQGELYYDLASEFSYKRQFIPDASAHYQQVTMHLEKKDFFRGKMN